MKSQSENITTTSETQEPQYSLVCPVCRKVYKTKVPYEKLPNVKGEKKLNKS